MVSVFNVGWWRWTAPVLCPDHRPDGFVLEEAPGRLSLVCMGENGDYREVGAWRPLAVLLVAGYGLVVVVTHIVWWSFRDRA